MEENMPAPTPDKVPRKLTAGHRTIFLWVALVALFVVVYQVMTPSGHPAAPPSERTRITWWLLGNVLPVLVVLAIFVFFFRGLRFAPFNRQVGEANRLLAEGRVAEAAERFEQMARPRFAGATLKAQARHNLAVARIHQGRPDEAVALLVGVERREWRAAKGGLPELNAWRLAEACALAGDADASGEWLKAAQARQGSEPLWLGLLTTPLVRCRQGRFDEAARFIDDNRGQAEGSLTGRHLRTLSLLRAFAESARGPFTARLGDLLAAARPVETGGHDWLATRWPELRRFLEANGLTA
jgi:hypothetical protein